jgi:anti-anti-sigma factor
VVDLRDTEFMDSTTLATLLAARRTAEQNDVGFTFVLPMRTYTEVNQLLDVTGLGSTLAIFDTLDEALAAARDGKTKGDTQIRHVA